ncbi:hypothetical protein K492DRAFT_194030 [Lichtheimia hyalospora FSU 10163]|nr:hypothetical protein K492DRAFT_194030 [Lichtheimia hyalospora FSU 10163]
MVLEKFDEETTGVDLLTGVTALPLSQTPVKGIFDLYTVKGAIAGFNDSTDISHSG